MKSPLNTTAVVFIAGIGTLGSAFAASQYPSTRPTPFGPYTRANLAAISASDANTPAFQNVQTYDSAGVKNWHFDPSATAITCDTSPNYINNICPGGVATNGAWISDGTRALTGTPITLFGASTGATDNGSAINATITAVQAGLAPAPIYIPQGTWRFTTPISNANNTPFVTAGKLVWAGSGVAAVVVGNSSGITTAASAMLNTYNIERETINYADTYPLIEFRNLYKGSFLVRAANGQRCVQLRGTDGYGTAYLNLTIQESLNCEKNVYFLADGGVGGGGWVNQNTITGLSFQNWSSSSSSNQITGFTLENNGTHPFNGNVINSGSFEVTNIGSGGLAFIEPIGTMSGNTAMNNVFNNPRLESHGSSGGAWLISGTADFQQNLISNIGYSILEAPFFKSSIASVKTGYALNEITASGASYGNPARPASGWTPLVKIERGNVIASGATPAVQAPARGKFWDGYANSDNSAFANTPADPSYSTLTATGVQVTNGKTALVTILDLRRASGDWAKKVRVHAELNASTAGRFAAIPFDATSPTNQILGSAGDLRDTAGSSYQGYPNGHLWTSGSDLTGTPTADYAFGSNVAFVALGVTKGTTNADIKSFWVEVPDGSGITVLNDASSLSQLSGLNPLINSNNPQSAATPTSTTDVVGTVVWNRAPAIGAAPYWIKGASAWIAAPNLSN